MKSCLLYDMKEWCFVKFDRETAVANFEAISRLTPEESAENHENTIIDVQDEIRIRHPDQTYLPVTP
jgi:hypothetical protein